MPRKHMVVDYIVGHLAMLHAMWVTRERLYYDDLYANNRFGRSRPGALLAAMFPVPTSVDITDVDGLSAALGTVSRLAVS